MSIESPSSLKLDQTAWREELALGQLTIAERIARWFNRAPPPAPTAYTPPAPTAPVRDVYAWRSTAELDD